jgi:PKD repeat protein
VGIALLVGLLSGCTENTTSNTEPASEPKNTAPNALFEFEIDGFMVNFTDKSSDADGDNLTYSWDFGDDTTLIEQNPSHTYVTNGTYSAVLTVNDDKEESTYQQTVIIGNVAPIAAFTYTITNLTVNFTDDSQDLNGDYLTYLWDLGDGTTNDAQNPIYTYATAGTYNVTLTVTDIYNETDITDLFQITVAE